MLSSELEINLVVGAFCAKRLPAIKKVNRIKMFLFIDLCYQCLFDNNLLYVGLVAAGNAEEVNTLRQIIDVDLFQTLCLAIEDLLTHVVVQGIVISGIDAFDVQGAVGGVRIDLEGLADFSHFGQIFNCYHDGGWDGHCAIFFRGNDAVFIVSISHDLSEGGFGDSGNFFTVAKHDKAITISV